MPESTPPRSTRYIVDLNKADKHNNVIAREGVDRCSCGCKYWESDMCIDCDTHIESLIKRPTLNLGDLSEPQARHEDSGELS